MQLKRHVEQKWYYYPEMTNDEVLVFKQYECFKGIDDVEDAPLKTCFHTAFNDPQTPWFGKVEARKSAEHRIRLFLK